MLCTRRFVVLVVLVFLHPLFGEDAKQPSTQQLIDQLGHKQFSQREKAFKLLQSRGSSALPELKKALQHPDEEVRTRVEKLIPLLEQLAALEPKAVTLNVDQQTLSFILKEIEKQTGYKLESMANSEEKKVSIQMKNVPFWQAIEQLRRETSQSIQFQLQNDSKGRNPRQTLSQFVSVHGVFRVEATNLHEDRDVKFELPSKENPSGTKTSRFTMTLAVIPEPRFQILSIGNLTIDNIVDENNKSFPLPKVTKEESAHKRFPRVFGSEFRGYSQEQSVATQNFSFHRSSENAKGIKELRGMVPVVMIIEKKQVAIKEKFLECKGTKIKTGDLELEITQADQDANGVLRFEARIPPEEADSPRINWHSRFYLVDSTRKRLQNFGSGTSSSGRGDQRISLDFAKSTDAGGNDKVKLMFEDWIMVRCEVPFVLKDIPLP